MMEAEATQPETSPSSSFADSGMRVLKAGETFATLGRGGDVAPKQARHFGLFHRGTRYLSEYRLLLGDRPPILLSSAVSEDNLVLTVECMNPSLPSGHGTAPAAQGTVHLKREFVVDEGVIAERLVVQNFGAETFRAPLRFEIDSDYADLFEIRGVTRTDRGRLKESQIHLRSIVRSYRGLDEVERSTRVTFSEKPSALDGSSATFNLELEPEAVFELEVEVRCDEGSVASISTGGFTRLCEARARRLALQSESQCEISTSNELCNLWISRSLSDLRMMLTEKPTGLYPYAGVPWFSTSFGRDGLLTALQALWVDPNIAKGVLLFLAREQARESDATTEADPGKILHESREGEMANLGEIPFRRYFGSVDATPLFIVLAGRYFRHTADGKTIRALWPHLELADQWLERHGDVDGDGFVEYARRGEDGLIQQGWKDSHDSVFHADGSDAKGPVALCEVQGYVYAAKIELAHIAEYLGHVTRATTLRKQARRLKEAFDEQFWLPELKTYALALDGNKNPCRLVSSNAGQCLFTGIVSEARARDLADTLLSPAMFSGWGVRTLREGQARYNPMSYHNGSVWPHDNALIAQGLSEYGFREHAEKIFEGLFGASLHFDLHRLPELFCGFPRRGPCGPTAYPVACAPQAWSAATVCMLFGALLGLKIDGEAGRLELVQPLLPKGIDRLTLRGLHVGTGRLDLEFTQQTADVSINVLRRDPGFQVAVVK